MILLEVLNDALKHMAIFDVQWTFIGTYVSNTASFFDDSESCECNTEIFLSMSGKRYKTLNTGLTNSFAAVPSITTAN